MRASLPLALSACFLQPAFPAQTAAPRPHHAAAAAAGDPAHGADKAAANLPVTRVSLYKNGVGFFEHVGRVTGDASLRLDLSSAQLDDVLQTLTAIDLGGGHITGANYNSTTPLEQQLHNLPLSLGEEPTEEQLYNALRGARVEVTGSGAPFTGRVLAVEVRNPPGQATGDGKEASNPVFERRVLTVIADSGATRTLELTPNTTVRVLDGGLRTDLNTYLELLDGNRSNSGAGGIRHLVLTDRGTGAREIRVSFLSEVPVWKSTYRLLVTSPGGAGGTSGGQATLQGFSVVDNTTGEDWKNVQLSLIAGSPQSFLQPLAQPIYDRRPEIPIAENAQMTPQTHDAAMEENETVTVEAVGNLPVNGRTLASPSKIAKNINMMKDTGPPPPPAPPPFGAAALAAAAPYETLARESVAPNATAKAFDDFFSYTIADPVTIPRNGSALVPILQAQVPVESVTLWSASEPTPLRALWLTNGSPLTLDRGSFSIVEDGAFAGEGLLDAIHPGERRLLSYAADQAVRVIPEGQKDTRRVTSVSVSKGVLRAVNAEVAEVNYTVTNAAPEARTVIVEEGRRGGWTLESDAKPAETTPSAYRFRVVAAPHATEHLAVRQRRVVEEYFRLASTSEESLTVYLHNNGADTAVVSQLEPVFAAKRTVADLDRRLRDQQAKIEQIVEDQKRVRDNLGALKGSAEERSLAKRYTGELNAQEDSLATLRRDLAALQEQRTAAQAELSRRIESLQIPGVEQGAAK